MKKFSSGIAFFLMGGAMALSGKSLAREVYRPTVSDTHAAYQEFFTNLSTDFRTQMNLSRPDQVRHLVCEARRSSGGLYDEMRAHWVRAQGSSDGVRLQVPQQQIALQIYRTDAVRAAISDPICQSGSLPSLDSLLTSACRNTDVLLDTAFHLEQVLAVPVTPQAFRLVDSRLYPEASPSVHARSQAHILHGKYLCHYMCSFLRLGWRASDTVPRTCAY